MNQKKGTGQLYTGYYDCLRKILKQSGVRGLYAGLGAVCVGVGPEKAIKLTANDFCREKFQGLILPEVESDYQSFVTKTYSAFKNRILKILTEYFMCLLGAIMRLQIKSLN